MKKRNIKYLNGKVVLHPTDWKILKQEGKLHYCDDCEHITCHFGEGR
ncbi:hypothetical protein [Fictibacillus sp. S7]|nr:hypothetical protein [Fictibacillus sp. S7]